MILYTLLLSIFTKIIKSYSKKKAKLELHMQPMKNIMNL